jgi:hypothetical protein
MGPGNAGLCGCGVILSDYDVSFSEVVLALVGSGEPDLDRLPFHQSF